MAHVAEVIKAFGKQGAEFLEAEQHKPVADSLQDVLNCGTVVPSSLCRLADGIIGIVDLDESAKLFAVARASKVPLWLTRFQGESSEVRGLQVMMAGMQPENAAVLRQFVPFVRPRTLGLNPSFGFGDRIGLATGGHALAMAVASEKILPIFAQQSIREMSRTARSAVEVVDDATWGVLRAGWIHPFGADADHLKTKSDVASTARAGFTFFTIDPGEYVDQKADDYNRIAVEEKFQELAGDKTAAASDFMKLYRGKTFKLEAEQETFQVTFEEHLLKRAAIKSRTFGRTQPQHR